MKKKLINPQIGHKYILHSFVQETLLLLILFPPCLNLEKVCRRERQTQTQFWSHFWHPLLLRTVINHRCRGRYGSSNGTICLHSLQRNIFYFILYGPDGGRGGQTRLVSHSHTASVFCHRQPKRIAYSHVRRHTVTNQSSFKKGEGLKETVANESVAYNSCFIPKRQCFSLSKLY